VNEIVVYHNPDAMGYPASKVTKPVIVTNKTVSPDTVGSRVWLLTGEGQPRRFYVRGTFLVNRIESGEDEGFRTRVWGTGPRFAKPLVEITDEPWFDDFKRSQGNFAFGFQSIRDTRFVRGLEAAFAKSR
jgi:hypothetical protein